MRAGIRVNIDLLPMPADEHRIDLLLQREVDPRTGKTRAGFEKGEQSASQDAALAISLIVTANTLLAAPGPANSQLTRLNLNPQAATNLADRLDAGVEA